MRAGAPGHPLPSIDREAVGERLPNPVVVLPGVLGSTLTSRDDDAQLPFGGSFDATDPGADHLRLEGDPSELTGWSQQRADSAILRVPQVVLGRDQERAARLEAWAADLQCGVVAHSIGGSVATYQLLHGDAPLTEVDSERPTLAGAVLIDRLILLGSPLRGAPVAREYLESLYEIDAIGTFTLLKASPLTLGTMPSVYLLWPHG